MATSPAIKLNYDVTLAATKGITSTTGSDGTIVGNTNAGAGGNYVTGKTVYDYVTGTDHGLLSSTGLDTALRDGTVQLGAADSTENGSGSKYYHISITDTAVQIKTGNTVIAEFVEE